MYERDKVRAVLGEALLVTAGIILYLGDMLAYILFNGDYLDFAYDSISVFSSRKDSQDAVFGAGEGLKDTNWVRPSICFLTLVLCFIL
ncbi:hypothetical protein IFM89_027409 [Coptis chinensis]|uniref:Uncharacterized protein n=1 Tax=Coptis chinensis TaxID=261450 RepID=A0A835IFF6_9MAGN|nr:hypothetical protein IFM89_027409 [Coptis chinensis]